MNDQDARRTGPLAPAVRSLLRFLAVALLIGLGFVGLRNGVREWSEGVTIGQRVATWAELGSGVFALLSGVGVLSRHRWTLRLLIAWAVCITVTAGLAPVVWGGAGVGAALAAGGGTALIAFGIVWLGRRGLVA